MPLTFSERVKLIKPWPINTGEATSPKIPGAKWFKLFRWGRFTIMVSVKR